MMDIGYGRAKYTDPYLLFKKKKNNTSTIEYDDENIHRFNACDNVDFGNDGQSFNGDYDANVETLTIETPTKNYTFEKDDKVFSLKDRCYWLVLSSTIADDGQAKELSLRPRKITYIRLIKMEE